MIVDDSDVPDTGAVFTFGKSRFAENLPNKFWIKNDVVNAVSCGDEHTTLIAGSGRLFTFGNNDWGQLGHGHKSTVTKPSCVKSLKPEKCKLVACGRTHTLVATETNSLISFGCNSEGQLGVGSVGGEHTAPETVSSLQGVQLKQLAAGTDHSAALTVDGKLYVWGSNEHGQLGVETSSGSDDDDDDDQVSSPTLLPWHQRITSVSCGYYHTAFVTDDGNLYAFGEVEGGKVGVERGGGVNRPKLVNVAAGVAKVVAVSSGGNHTLCLTDRGEVFSFGGGSSGQLGLGTSLQTTHIPTSIDRFKRRKARSIATGDNHSAVITESGHLYAFGDGRHGKLALDDIGNSTSNHFKPALVKRFNKFRVKHVACGGCHTIVLASKMPEDSSDVAATPVEETLPGGDMVNGSGDKEKKDDGKGDEKSGGKSEENGETLQRKDSLELNKKAREKRREKEGVQTKAPRILPPLKLEKGVKNRNPLDKGKLPEIKGKKVSIKIEETSPSPLEMATIKSPSLEKVENDVGIPEEERGAKKETIDVKDTDEGEGDKSDEEEEDDDDEDDDSEEDEDKGNGPGKDEKEEKKELTKNESKKEPVEIKEEKKDVKENKDKITMEKTSKPERPKTSKGIRSFFSRTFSRDAKHVNEKHNVKENTNNKIEKEDTKKLTEKAKKKNPERESEKEKHEDKMQKGKSVVKDQDKSIEEKKEEDKRDEETESDNEEGDEDEGGIDAEKDESKNEDKVEDKSKKKQQEEIVKENFKEKQETKELKKVDEEVEDSEESEDEDVENEVEDDEEKEDGEEEEDDDKEDEEDEKDGEENKKKATLNNKNAIKNKIEKKEEEEKENEKGKTGFLVKKKGDNEVKSSLIERLTCHPSRLSSHKKGEAENGVKPGTKISVKNKKNTEITRAETEHVNGNTKGKSTKKKLGGANKKQQAYKGNDEEEDVEVSERTQQSKTCVLQ